MQKIFLLILILQISHIFMQDDTNTSKNGTVEVSQGFLDSSVLETEWCGDRQNTENILLLTESGTVYRSRDKGQTWMDLKSMFESTARQTMDWFPENVGRVVNMQRSTSDTNLIFFLGSDNINWVSTNCGIDIIPINIGQKISEIQLHPTEKNWIIFASWNECDVDDDQCDITKDLYISQDLGKNYRFLKDYVTQFAWGVIDESFLATIPKERILIAHQPNGKGDQQEPNGWSNKIHIGYSDDFFKTHKNIIQHGNLFQLSERYIFAAKLLDQNKQDVTLMVADPRERVYNFKEIQLPSQRTKDHGYTILDTSEGQIFLHVNHYGEESKFGSIYISDSTGQRFSSSLINNPRNADGMVDFEKLESMDGVYLANIYDAKKAKQALNKPKNSDFTNSNKGKKELDELENFKETVITFNKGGIWKNIEPPTKDSLGQKVCLNQENDCYLHFNSLTNFHQYGPIYSSKSAVGLMIGTGGVGKYLPSRADQINTYFSRDGGLTWDEIAKGSHIYELGDHGGLLVMAQDQDASNSLTYSWDQGLTWDTFKMSQKKFEIENIIMEPSNTASHFLVIGNTADGKGIVVSLDFSSLHQRNCAEAENPNTESSDYETWSPSDNGSREKCLLGHVVSYVRRKQDAKCFNTMEFEPQTIKQSCVCTEENWECDIGFSRDGDGPCLKTTNKKNTTLDFKAPANCTSSYLVSQGYRKIAGDLCEGGVNHAPLVVPCPGVTIFSQTNMTSVGVLSLIIVVLLYFGGFLSNLQEFVLDKISSISFSRGDTSGYSNQQNTENFNNMMFDNDEEDQSLQ